ncbi:MAG: hypothetical protein UY35_C0002G0034 [Candidatus Saccharibacteria bacterium GW2011_GWC2_48_9]|nr:MAG: hypothetical protein UY35_C0002G0034 [Candidatus Saccharibacteria bacterium GW2011_GWC2_48_9]HCH34923.1 hypothetical protein [Candidatus Saccharibacteria bacterium]
MSETKSTRNEVLLPKSELSLFGSMDNGNIPTLTNLVRHAIDDVPRAEIKKTLFVVGPHASGKSALAKAAMIGDLYRFVDTGPVLRSYHTADGPSMDFGPWIEMHEEHYGNNFTNDLLAGHIEASLANEAHEQHDIVVIGNRSYSGVERLGAVLAPDDSKVLYIDAPKELLYQRYCMRENKSLDRSEFQRLLDRDSAMGLDELADHADWYVLNDGSFDEGVHAVGSKLNGWTTRT